MRSRKRRIRRWPIRSPQRCKPPVSLRNASPATSWRRPPPSAPRTAGGCGCSRRSGDGCSPWAIRPNRCLHRKRCVRCRGLQATPSKAGALSPRIRTGPVACAIAGRPARYPVNGGSRNFLLGAWPATPARATGQTARARPAYPRTCASAKSARGRSGTPPALPRPNALPCQAMSKSSSANWAGANSAAICCSTCRIWRCAICSPPSTPSLGGATTRRCGRGNVAGPAIRSSMPGMRELWRTGAMHNRVRMVVASFLVKHLLIDWREGERWFWDTLVDADCGQQSRQLAVGGGFRRRCRALFPGVQSDPAGREIRS